MDKYVVVTGATGNIGGKICAALLDKNINVIFTTRDSTLIEVLNDDFKNVNSCAKFLGMTLDLADEVSAKKFLENTKRYSIVSFISNAAIDNLEFVESINYDMLRLTMKVNFEIPAMIISHLVKRWKRERVDGKIIGISSLCAVMGDEKSSVYAASKAALESYIRCVAVELGKYGISANVLRVSALGAKLIGSSDKSRVIHYSQNFSSVDLCDLRIIPSRHLVNTDALTKMIIHLLQDNGNITGQTINVDCGLSVVYPKYKNGLFYE